MGDLYLWDETNPFDIVLRASAAAGRSGTATTTAATATTASGHKTATGTATVTASGSVTATGASTAQPAPTGPALGYPLMPRQRRPKPARIHRTGTAVVTARCRSTATGTAGRQGSLSITCRTTTNADGVASHLDDFEDELVLLGVI